MKNMICISGNIAVGKSEVAVLISEKLNFELYKASNSFRQAARENNMNLVDFNEYVKANPEVDKSIEAKTKNVVDTKNNIIIDARLGFFVAPEAFKVYMTADIDVAAIRLFEAAKTRGQEENYDTVDEARLAIELREKSERDRYFKLYGVDLHNLANYDLVIDTTHLSSDEVADKIIEAFKIWEG